MKSQEINTMEGEILTEENLPEDEKPKVKNPKLKTQRKFSLPSFNSLLIKIENLPNILKNPRFIIIFSLILIIPFIYIAFTLLGSKPTSQTPAENPAPEILNPSPPIDKKLQDIENKIKSLQTEVDLLDANFVELALPEVDLNIKF